MEETLGGKTNKLKTKEKKHQESHLQLPITLVSVKSHLSNIKISKL
jgi:hypothetical protein